MKFKFILTCASLIMLMPFSAAFAMSGVCDSALASNLVLKWKKSEVSIKNISGQLIDLEIVDSQFNVVARVTKEEFAKREGFVREQISFWRQRAGENLWEWYKLMLKGFELKEAVLPFNTIEDAENAVRSLYKILGHEKSDWDGLDRAGLPVYEAGGYYYCHYKDALIWTHSEQGQLNTLTFDDGFREGIFKVRVRIKRESGSVEYFEFLMELDLQTQSIRTNKG